jgi:hypothetical protein
MNFSLWDQREFFGTLFPLFLAFDSPIAMACLRLLTLPLTLPRLPLRAVPRL